MLEMTPVTHFEQSCDSGTILIYDWSLVPTLPPITAVMLVTFIISLLKKEKIHRNLVAVSILH